jgi:hypothetical protein
MKALRTAAGLLVATAISLAASAPAMALEEEESTVPPENSAVNQYTEAFPTARGEKEARSGGGRHVSTAKVLGSTNAKKLEKHGSAGRATAKFAADTAPRAVHSAATGSGSGGRGHSGQAGAVSPGGGSQGGGGGGTGGGNPASGGSGGGQHGKAPSPSTPPGPTAAAHPAQADGSSGLSEVLSRATGSTSGGGMGIFLPLLIVAAIAWAIAYSVRQRRTVS